MKSAYQSCMERMEHEAKYESWEQLLVKDRNSFLQVVVQKYVQNRIPQEKIEEVFRMLGDVPGNDERFITVCVDIDLAYKITNPLDYEASRFALIRRLEEVIGSRFFFWRTEGCGEECAFIIRTAKKDAVRTLKEILEHVKEMRKAPWWRQFQSRIKRSPGYSGASPRRSGCSGWRAYPAQAHLPYWRRYPRRRIRLWI